MMFFAIPFCSLYTLMNSNEKGDMNFSLYMKSWLSHYIKDKLKPNTYKTYLTVINNHAIPQFRNMELKSLKPMMYQKFIDSKVEDGLSTETARRIHNAMNQAYKRRYLMGM